MEICKMLTLSTAHIKEETAEVIYKRSAPWANYDLAIYDKDEFGWWINLSDVEMAELRDVPSDLVECIKLALGNGCAWLCLDSDGPVEDCLPIYEWNNEKDDDIT